MLKQKKKAEAKRSHQVSELMSHKESGQIKSQFSSFYQKSGKQIKQEEELREIK